MACDILNKYKKWLTILCIGKSKPSVKKEKNDNQPVY